MTQDNVKKNEHTVLSYVFHGSGNSLDKDVFLVVPAALDTTRARSLYAQYPEFNCNAVVVGEGALVWSHKGVVDETNNSLLDTYHLHDQVYPMPITQRLERQYGLKALRTLRGCLSYFSRTPIRGQIKNALRSSSIQEKLEALRLCDLTQIEDFGKTTRVEVLKFFAFQLGQTLALLEDGVELFTKDTVAQYYKELGPYLRREAGADASSLQHMLMHFAKVIENGFAPVESGVAFNSAGGEKMFENKGLYNSYFQGVCETIDISQEKLILRSGAGCNSVDKRRCL